MASPKRVPTVSTFGLAVAAGLALSLGAPPREWPLLPFAFPPLLLLAVGRLPQRAWRQAFAVGLVAGTTANLVAFDWIVGLLERFGGFPTAAAVLVGALLWVGQGLALAAAATFCHALGARRRTAWVTLPAALVVVGTTGPALFPWRISAPVIPWTAWIQLAELGGEPLLDLLIALTGCAAVECLRRPSLRTAAVAALALGGPWLYGMMRLPAVRAARADAPAVRVGVVQPNVSIEEKGDPAYADARVRTLRSMTDELESRGAELVVWPETAYPYPLPHSLDAEPRGPRALRSGHRHAALLAGAITTDPADRYNSTVAFDVDGRVVGIADKLVLLAFGEYVPLWDLLPPLRRAFPSRGLREGRRPPLVLVAGARVGVLNCYEDILSAHARWLAALGPELLVNVTNDAWFGHTQEPHLHHLVARIRAVEARRDLVRAVNTGVSGHTASTGEDLARTPTWTRTSFVADARRLTGTTPWVRLGDLVTPTAAAWLLALALARTIRDRRAPGGTPPRTGAARASR